MAEARATARRGGAVRPRTVFYRGSPLGSREFARIQRLVDARPELTREALAREIARRFRWRRPDGHLAVSSCRLLLGRLARRGWLRLPTSRRAGNAGAPAPAGQAAEPAPPQVITAVNGPVVVRPIVPAEAQRWRLDVGRYHYLGAGPLVGETLRYVALAGDEPVAWLGWAAAALYNPPRDRYLGWDTSTRRRRLPWVVNNVRFLILPWVHVPNLASRILAANLRRVVRDWHAVYGHPVLLAETFVDATRFRGTCYRASNWLYVGDTLGFSRRGAHYAPNGSPKHVFVYPLGPRACERLRAPELSLTPSQEDATMVKLDVRRLPLDGRGGLIELLRGLRDPRQPRGRRHSLVSIMAIAVGATLAGAQSLMAIAHWAADQSAPTLRRLGCRGRVPSEATIRRVLGRVDIRAMDERVGVWLAQQAPLAGHALAIDGKSLRGSAEGDTKAVHLVSAVLHREAVVVGQHRVADKTNEISSPTPLLAPLDITGAVVTGDAMFAQKTIATHVVEDKHADYLFTVKDNQPTLRQDIEDLHLEGAFPPQHTTYDKGHGRIEERRIWTSTELVGYAEFPYAQQVFRIEHTVCLLDSSPRSHEVLYGITSLPPAAAAPARLLALHRGHWSIENKVHYVRDRTFDEDRSQVRKHGAPHAMASLRNLAISLLRLARADNIAAALRSCARKVRLTLRLLGL